jgi:D-lactate dehydrogenase (cytochrome)
VIRVGAEDLDATVEAGVTRLQLNKAAQHRSPFPVDPGADATIGGMAGDARIGNDSRALRDDARERSWTHDRLADGTAIHTGTRARKSSAGTTSRGCSSDLKARWASSPRSRSGCIRCRRRCRRRSAHSSRSRGAVETVIATIQLGVQSPASNCSTACRWTRSAYSKTSYALAPTLFFEFHSDSERHVADRRRRYRARGGARRTRVPWATRLEDREKLWQARHDALYVALALRRARVDDRRLRSDFASRRMRRRNHA